MTPKDTKDEKPPFVLGYGEYLRFSKLALDRFGLNFPEKRRAELEWALKQAFAASTCANLDEYYTLLNDPQNGAMELDRLVNAITVCETHFFRDAAQFGALYTRVLPEIIERRRALRTLRIWSAGCASGEEPYSIAMLLRDLLPDVNEWSITILGTDVNTQAMDRARKAVYGEWAFREERAKQWRGRFFTPKENHYELNPDVRRMVTFQRLNLAEFNYPSYDTNTTFMDLILCRNVTIYFPEVVTRSMVDCFYQALVDGGWLVVGHSEHSLDVYKRFQTQNFPDAILYRRGSQPMAPFPDPDWLQKVGGEPIPEAKQKSPQPAAKPVEQAPTVQPVLLNAAEMIDRARELLDGGRSEQARDLLLKLIEQEPRNVAACTLLGQSYANLGNLPEAERWCNQAIKFDKLNREAYYILSLAHQHQGKLAEAIDAMKKVIYIDQSSVLGHFGLADLYYSNNQHPQALKSLDNARRLLASRPAEDVVPNSGGVTCGRLLQAIVRRQQQWTATASLAQAIVNQRVHRGRGE